MDQVGDFGLARRQSSGEEAEETRVLGTIGYLAPEYAETGQITDKADVYAFGVCLLELITGRKAIDYTRSRNQISLIEWVSIMNASRFVFCDMVFVLMLFHLNLVECFLKLVVVTPTHCRTVCCRDFVYCIQNLS
jgi:serine/threonine protein kinase